MLPKNKIDELIKKHSLLEKELSSLEINKKNFAEKSKEYSDLNEIIDAAKRYQNFEKEKNDLQKIIEDPNSDKDFKDMALIELNDLNINHDYNEKKIKLFLLPKDDADKKMRL